MPALELDRRTLRLIAVAFILLTALSVHRLFLADPLGPNDILILSGQTMGTTYEIRIAGPGPDKTLRKRVTDETERRLLEIDQWMSNWNPDSEIARFNAHASTRPFPVALETAEVVAYALQLSDWSGGAFDITVGPLVALWGFGHRPRLDASPREDEIASLKERTGPGMLRVGLGEAGASPFLAKNDPEVEIDLSAIAKGFGVDHVADGLESLGLENYLIEIGGELRAAGLRPTGEPWRVAIERPQIEGRAIQLVIELSDRAMATSGDYRIFYFENGEHVSHTIDPRTGHPVQNGPASVTILADTATEADAWATTLMVVGERDGLSLASRHGIAAMILQRMDDGSIAERRNDLFPADKTGQDVEHQKHSGPIEGLIE
jgi:thiamine biosynthesis lipoprotein